MKNIEDQMSAPGISLKKILQTADKSTLIELLGSSIIETISLLEPSVLANGQLGEFASQFFDPFELLRDEEKRNLIINELPDQKVQELGVRLGIDKQNIKRSEICTKVHDSNHFSDIYSFFGIAQEARAATISSPDKTIIDPNYSLFSHQREVADKVLTRLDKVPNRLVLHMPTGSGKTRTAMHIVTSHLRNNEKSVVVWLAVNSELLEQAASEFEIAWKFLGNRSVEVLRFWNNRSPDLENISDGMIVAGLQKMNNLYNTDKLLRLADVVSFTIVDEAHQAIAPTYNRVISTLTTKKPNSKLLGLTATPGRSWLDIEKDDVLAEFFGREKVTLEIDGYSNPVNYLIDEEYLARPEFRELECKLDSNNLKSDLKNVSSDVDFSKNLLDELGDQIERNCQIVNAIEELLKRHKRIIVFAPSVKNARLITAILKLKKHEAELILGETNKTQRERIIRKFKKKGQHPIVLINYGVLTTGFDAPNISAAVIARPTKSLVLYSQMVGRATRGTRAGGNEKAEIVTIVDTNLPGFGSMEESFKFWDNDNLWEQ